MIHQAELRPGSSAQLVVYLVVHAVDPVWPQQVDGLADEVRASAVEHPETQVQVELVRGGFGVEALEGAEAAFRPEDDRRRWLRRALAPTSRPWALNLMIGKSHEKETLLVSNRTAKERKHA